MAYTTIDDPTIYFNTKLYTGNGGTNAITGVGFQPDWVWCKRRDSSAAHYVWDVVRGAATQLYPASASSEDAGQTNGLSAFGSDGFTLGSDAGANANSGTFVSWNWSAGGSASSNEDGSITSSVSANTTAGFSIVSFTGNGSAGATVGHGLGSEVKFIIIKNRDASQSWIVGTSAIGFTQRGRLNDTPAFSSTSATFNNTAPTSSVFTLGGDGSVNASGQDLIAYCFAEKKGYSKFGSYTGNGNADGPFIFTGFRPAMIIKKPSSRVGDWSIEDNKRNTGNVISNSLIINRSDAEVTTTSFDVDFVSNGFKVRATNTHANQSGETYIYMAFAKMPFVTSTGIPTTAR